MTFTDATSGGTSGTFTDSNGTTITWTSDRAHSNNTDQFWGYLQSGVELPNGSVNYTLTDGSGGGAVGLNLYIMAMTVGDNTVVVNGVNLGTLIANGDASVVDPSTPGYPKGTQGWDPTTNQATLSGSTISGAGAGVPEDAILINFTIPVTSISVTDVNEDGWNGVDLYVGVICFASGTLIETQSGEVAIDDLCVGDMVLTMDHGYQPIRWIGSTKRPATGDLAPILIRKGALGNTRDLRVSPQHRMLLSGWQAEVLFGESEVLATAKSLVNDHSILREEGGEVEYFHMLFDTHEIVYAEGAPSESFHPGAEGWKALDAPTRNEILELFPQLANGNFDSYGPSARPSLKHQEGYLLGQSVMGQTQH